MIGAVAACAQSDELLTFGAGENVEDASTSGTFVPTDAATPDAVAVGDASETLSVCASSECPDPYTTCPTTSGLLPRYKCSTNLRNDRENCGRCGNSCSVQAPSSVRLECIEGECKALCPMGRVDCNGVIDDGCEADPLTDEKNCGACGRACADGVSCIDGTCGCPTGKVECGGKCVDLTTDDANCGACGFACASNQPDAKAPPTNMYYGCGSGTCNTLKCAPSAMGWADCNGDLADGCELPLGAKDSAGYNDPNNCGGCGVVCKPNQKCFATLSTTTKCQCDSGQTVCGPGACADLQSDPNNCGSCGYMCGGLPGSAQGLHTTCERGRCGFACDDGKSDCNGMIDDGCEADVLRDPRNCGGCGITCDIASGQPCVNGMCVTEPCDAGGVVK